MILPEQSGLPWSREAGVLNALLRIVIPLFAVIAIAGFPASLWFQRQSPPIALPWALIVASIGTGIVVVLLVARVGRHILLPVLGLVSWLPLRLHWALVTGLLLRVAVPLAIHARPVSDGATYLQLGEQLAAGAQYQVAGTLAYWPPGLPMLLASLIALFGDRSVVVMVFGLIAFLVAAIGTWKLGAEVGLGRHAVLPVWLLACWPTLILCTGLPEKELLVTALLPLVLLFGIRMARGSTFSAFLAGALLGFVTLTQPSFQLFVFIPFALAPWITVDRTRFILRCTGGLIAMAVILAPWMYRNHVVLGSTAIATNGGGNLYRANNPLATGGYTRVGEVDLDALGEIANDREGKKLAVEWILRDPVRFVRLMAGKTLLFAGDDSYGAYLALRIGQPAAETSAKAGLYPVAKLISAVPWLLLWVVAAASARQRRMSLNMTGLVVFVPYLYLSSIHSIFESGGKYHLPALTCLFVGLVWLLIPPTEGNEPQGGEKERESVANGVTPGCQPDPA